MDSIKFRDGDSLVSSVFGLNASPQMAIFLFFSEPRVASAFRASTPFCASFTSRTASSNGVLRSLVFATYESARISLGKQLPPKPGPAYKKSYPIRLSLPITARTCSISAPVASEIALNSFINEIREASIAFDAYLPSSADSLSTMTSRS